MRIKLGLYISLLFMVVACSQPLEEEKKEKVAKTEIIVRGEAQGTTYTVKYIAEEYNGVKKQLDSLLDAIDQSMSTYKPNSTVSRLNMGDTVIVDSMFLEVYELSHRLNINTRGAFNPTIGPLIKAWGFDYSNPQKMDSSKVEELLAASGFKHFSLEGNQLWKTNPLARINFNAIAQGYSVDLMARILDELGVDDYYVELGGELKVKGKNKFDNPWIVGVDKPTSENLKHQLANRFSLNNKAMATSGNYRKFYEVDGKRYSHTLNPITGFPAENQLLSATVISNNCMLADALATTFMVMGLDSTKAYLAMKPEVQAYLIIAADSGSYKEYLSPGLEEIQLKD